MNVLLINPKSNIGNDNEIFPRLSLLLLGTLLKQKGHKPSILHMVADNLSIPKVIRLIEDLKIEVVGITATTYQTSNTKLLSKTIKENYKDKVKVILGGPHVSAIKSEALESFPDIDIVILGEGEENFIKLVEGELTKNIAGILYREGDKIVSNTPSPFIELDNIPFPDLTLVNLKAFSGPSPIGRIRNMQIMASRGCPFSCTFCCKPIYKNLIRFHSPEYILEEIKYLNKDFSIQEICFQDDAINYNLPWATKIFEYLINSGLNKKIILRIGLRADSKLIDLDFLKLAKKAGVWIAFYGVESGSQYMLDSMNKKITLEEIERAFILTKEVGIKTIAPFIIGLPGETESTIKESINFYRKLKPYIGWFSRAMPFPGTAFRQRVIEEGNLLPGNYDEYSLNTPRVRTEALTVQELENWYKICNRPPLRDLVLRNLTNPGLLYRTIKEVGPREVVGKLIKNI